MARVPAIELAPGVVRIPTVGAASVNSFVLADGTGGVTLVDCGLRSAPARIVAGMRAAGHHPGDVRRIVLTHAQVLGELEYDRVAFAHGTEITAGARDAVRRLIAGRRDG